MADEEDNIYMDKRQLSLVVLIKESDFIELYGNLIKRTSAGFVKPKDIESTEDYDGCWNIGFELYGFLEFNKIASIEKKRKKGDELLKKIELLREIMAKYENIKEKVNFEDLQTIYPILRRLISLSGYHDDTFQQAEVNQTPQFLPTGAK